MSKPRKFYNIVENKDGTSADILLYGIIGDWRTDKPVNVDNFVKDFKKLEDKFDRINIRINSPGGSIWDGLAIYNTIARCEKETHTFVDGIALSMGAIIALAGDKVHIASNGVMMLHSAIGYVYGNATAFRKFADELGKHDKALATTVSEKTGLSLEDTISKWFDGEDHFFTADEAEEAKLVDVVENYKAKDVPEGLKNMSIRDIFEEYESESKSDDLLNDKNFMAKIAEKIKNLTKSKNKDMKIEDAKKLIQDSQLSDDKKKGILEFFNTISQADFDQLKGDKEDLTKIQATILELFGEAAKEEGFNLTQRIKDLLALEGGSTDIEKELAALKKDFKELSEKVKTTSLNKKDKFSDETKFDDDGNLIETPIEDIYKD